MRSGCEVQSCDDFEVQRGFLCRTRLVTGFECLRTPYFRVPSCVPVQKDEFYSSIVLFYRSLRRCLEIPFAGYNTMWIAFCSSTVWTRQVFHRVFVRSRGTFASTKYHGCGCSLTTSTPLQLAEGWFSRVSWAGTILNSRGMEVPWNCHH